MSVAAPPQLDLPNNHDYFSIARLDITSVVLVRIELLL